MSNARLVTAFDGTELNDDELTYLFNKYGCFTKNYSDMSDEKKKLCLSEILIEFGVDNEKNLLQKLSKNDYIIKNILHSAYPIYLDGKSNSPLDLALNSYYIKELFDNWIANQKENYENLNIGYIMKNNFVFSNFMYITTENWGKTLINNINNFLKKYQTDIVNNIYVVNTDALTTNMPSGTHWMAIYNIVESKDKLIHKTPKLAMKKEMEIIKWIKKTYKGKISNLIINDVKLFDYKIKDWSNLNEPFKFNEDFNLFDIYLILNKFKEKDISELKSPLYNFYGSIEYFDPMGFPIITKSTNNKPIDLKIKEGIISQCMLYTENNMLVLPIDWQKKQQNDSFCCGYHSLAFLYNRIFVDSYPIEINHLDREQVKKRMNKLFKFNPKLEKCFDLALSHEDMDIENPKIQEIYGSG